VVKTSSSLVERKTLRNVVLGGAKWLNCLGPHIIYLVVEPVCLGPALTRMVIILLIFEKVLFVDLLKYLTFGNKWCKCEFPAFVPSFVSLWQTTSKNIHFSTEFKTEDKLDYNFFPLTSGELKFKVRAPHDAHVALTSGPTAVNPMYEVSYKIFFEDA
jgi:hypothetical protein